MNTIRTLVFFAFMLSAMSVFSQQAVAEDALSATQTLKVKIDAILDVLKNPEFEGDENKEVRRQKIRDIVLHGFDFGRMAQSSLGKHWRGKTPEEKQDFTLRFQRLIENTYIAKLETYTNEKVVYFDEQRKTKKDREYAKIQTQVITDDGTEIPIAYLMYRQGKDPWLVFDINIEGVSMVNNYRSQFGEFLSQKSFSQLLNDIDEKNSSQ
ncbi:ABC transporter substrate-binding protein [Desulfobacter hydrogenophilus]|uniref:ABC transporter substrate-binding protein n=1 Tax=Desulfobacter hydrogenophilus TaxID=2291 RepID=A0A328F7I6_9BACT|nr:ABC transporter substrate-binding protein [Desulfobacter hydrogenophilus]NDY73668.1 ABC transporter substrate-binding protein [Desulfobacter hydrogenophilus]QBH14944.1 ABC transporter substrate-binding protein [Desulfobacter hydrogenophilus]RAM00604.1 ABC transporter substrate-binding protein [Desulfobacter hydrogenophilus]